MSILPWLIRMIAGQRIVPPGMETGDPAIAPRQFGIGHPIQLTTILPIAFGLAGLWVSLLAGPQDDMPVVRGDQPAGTDPHRSSFARCFRWSVRMLRSRHPSETGRILPTARFRRLSTTPRRASRAPRSITTTYRHARGSSILDMPRPIAPDASRLPGNHRCDTAQFNLWSSAFTPGCRDPRTAIHRPTAVP